MKLSSTTFLSALLLFATTTAFAQQKIMERSARKAPVWYNSSQSDYIITSAIASDIERAKSQCLDNVRNYIIDAVAQNVKATTESSITQESVNTGITSFLDQFSSSYQTQSANLPYLAGISISRIEDSYWEKRRDRATKEISYLYSIKYPFPSLELKKLTNEFRKRDTEMDAKLAALQTQFENITSIEQIGQSLNELTPLLAYFFDDVRRNAAQTLQRGYMTLYDGLSIERTGRELGQEQLAIMLRGKQISTSRGPVVKSETLTQLECRPEGTQWLLSYDYSNCNPAEENYYEVHWTLGPKNLRSTFHIDLGQMKIDLCPKKEIYLHAGERTDSTVSKVTIRMNLEAGDAKRYIVRGITLNVPALCDPMFLDNLNVQVANKGQHNIVLTWLGTLDFHPKQAYQPKLARGNMDVELPDGSLHRIDFSLPIKANW